MAAPVRATLEATLTEGERSVSNDWRLWFFPAAQALPGETAVYGTPGHGWLKAWQSCRESGRTICRLSRPELC